jgi:anti-sigma regulatory factor (Ser/Thr protein kinase)
MQLSAGGARPADGFRHEAFLYAGPQEFVAGAVPFIEDGLAAGEPVLVAVPAPRIELLRDTLGAAAESVDFVDMTHLGRNPARMIPAWREFVGSANGHGVRGIGEPIWAERSDIEVVECQHHETLLNLAFADSPPWTLLCPYDIETLSSDVIEEAQRSHPFVLHHGQQRESGQFHGIDGSSVLEGPLPEPSGYARELWFDITMLGEVRSFVAREAAKAGLGIMEAGDLVLAVNEIVTNSVIHASGRGQLRIWRDARRVVCEIRDEGTISEPLVGRELPMVEDEGGRGLWLANQLCDLVQIRSFAGVTVVRLHLELDGARVA